MMADNNNYYAKKRRRREEGGKEGGSAESNYIKKSPTGPSGEHKSDFIVPFKEIIFNILLNKLANFPDGIISLFLSFSILLRFNYTIFQV